MHALCEALRLGNALQKRDEARPFRCVEGSQQLGLVRRGYAVEVCKHGAPRGRQVERVRAPVDRVASPLGEATMLEVIDERDHGAAVDPKRDAEGLLRPALGSGEVTEHPEVSRMEVELGQALGEAPMRVGAQLHQEEAGTPAQPSCRGRLHVGGISGHAAGMIPCTENCLWRKQFPGRLI